MGSKIIIYCLKAIHRDGEDNRIEIIQAGPSMVKSPFFISGTGGRANLTIRVITEPVTSVVWGIISCIL